MQTATDHRLARLHDFIAGARWFGGKGREFHVVSTRRLRLAERVGVELVTLEYADGGTDVYQVPVSYHENAQQHLSTAAIGEWVDEELGAAHGYDALQDPEATALWLRAFADGATVDTMTFHRVGSATVDPGLPGRLLSGEQSNSSLVFGQEMLLKLFRRLSPGQNPDIEILAALTEAGTEHVAPLHGWVETVTEDGRPLQLGILQQFLRNASDGWVLALESLGDAESDEDAFADHATRLGEAVAEMHTALARSFPTESWSGPQLRRLADTMSARLDAAVRALPDLGPHASGLRAVFDAVGHLDHAVTAQRVHGDLHLGQTLLTPAPSQGGGGWKIIDFEGEPAKSLEERRAPDSPWRDVAGMLRSFDYAAESDLVGRSAERGRERRARTWAERSTEAFLDGYRTATGTELDLTLLRAYEADKAVYEAVYEARNRPTWTPIPLAAIARLTAARTAPT